MRKKSKYKPRPVITDTMTYLKAGMLPVTAAVPIIAKVRIANHSAILSLESDTATKEDMAAISHALITAQSLTALRIGQEYQPDLQAARVCLEKIAQRFDKWGKLQATKTEVATLLTGIDVYDAQLEVCTIAELEQAVKLAQQAIRCHHPQKHVGGVQSIAG